MTPQAAATTPPNSPLPVLPSSPSPSSSSSSSSASSTPPQNPSRRRLFALGGLFQKVAASPASPRRSPQSVLKHVASWGEAEGAATEEEHEDLLDDDDDLDVALSPTDDFAPALVDDSSAAFPSSLPPTPEWHLLPAHILELVVESCLLPENELTMPWKERAVRCFLFWSIRRLERKEKKRSGISASSSAASKPLPTSTSCTLSILPFPP